MTNHTENLTLHAEKAPTSEKVKPISGINFGALHIPIPVLLAPMAGITNTAFRRLCREYGGGLYVSEMITTRALVERNESTMRLIQHHPSEQPRSIQLYGTDARTMYDAARILVDEDRTDHIDMNFGCPVPKVTRKGGGAALPWKLDLFRDIVSAAVSGAGHVPVTVKMRMGIDVDHLTYLDAAKIAEEVGASAVALHARTANQHYSGFAQWDAIARLKETITSIPVLGNGDIWSGTDAVRMMDETGCDGVVVGRGCLGRPWLFGDLERSISAYLEGATVEQVANISYAQPKLGEVVEAFKRHARLLVEFFDSEEHGCRDIRKHVAWYFKGYPVGGELRSAMTRVTTLEELDALVDVLDPETPYPGDSAEGPRGRAGGAKRTVLPEGWLESRTMTAVEQDHLNAAEKDIIDGG